MPDFTHHASRFNVFKYHLTKPSTLYSLNVEYGPGVAPVQNNTGSAAGAPDCTVPNSCSTFRLTIDPSVGMAGSGLSEAVKLLEWLNGKGHSVMGSDPQRNPFDRLADALEAVADEAREQAEKRVDAA